MVGDGADAEAEILEGRFVTHCRFGRRLARRVLDRTESTVAASRSRTMAEQQRIDPPRLLQLALQPLQRHEHRARQTLLRPERELAELRCFQHAVDFEPQRAADVVAPAVQRAQRYRRRLLHAHQQRIRRRGLQLAGQPAAHERRVAPQRERVRIQTVEGPEALVDAVDLDRGRPPAARLVRHETLDRDQRRGGLETRFQPLGRQQAGTAGLRHEARAGHHAVYGAQPLERQRAQARPYRRPHEQRAGEHRHRHRDAGHDGEIGPPVVQDVPSDECGQAHARLLPGRA